MSNHHTLSVRAAAAAATTAATLLLTVAPALAQTAPEPNFAAPGTSLVVLPPSAAAPVESSIDLRSSAPAPSWAWPSVPARSSSPGQCVVPASTPPPDPT